MEILSPISIHPQLRANSQRGRCDLQSGGVMVAFEMGREEECGAVEVGKCEGGFEDGVA